MKKYTKLSVIAAAALLLSGSSLMAEERPERPEVERVDPTVVPPSKHESTVPESNSVEGYESSGYTYYGYGAGSYSYTTNIGAYAGYYDGSYGNYYNTNVGHYAGYYGYYSDGNTNIGYHAGYGSYGYSSYSVAVGHMANEVAYGNNLVAIGAYSGQNSYADNSVYLGYQAGYNNTRNNSLYIDSGNSGSSPLIYGEFDNDMVRINGTFEVTKGISSSLAVSDTANNHNILALNANNTGDGASDVGFAMENIETDFKWTFRTYNPSEGFAASKIGTGGTEFEIGNTGTTLATTVVKMGGVVVFKNGHLVNKSGNELTSLIQDQDIKLASMESTLNAKDAKIAQLESKMQAMQTRVAMMETIFTNLALATSSNKTEKVTLNSK